MPRLSFGLRQLFVWVAAIALGLVALRSATMTWAAGMLGLALAVLTMSILLVIFRRGSQRAYWIGFATVGWLYLLLVVASWTLGRLAQGDSLLRPDNLITQQAASASYHWLYDEAFENYYASGAASDGSMGGMMAGGSMGPAGGMMPGGMGPYGMGAGGPLPGPAPGPHHRDFVNVAHALWTLLFAIVGGCVAFWLYATGPGHKESSQSDSRLS